MMLFFFWFFGFSGREGVTAAGACNLLVGRASGGRGRSSGRFYLHASLSDGRNRKAGRGVCVWHGVTCIVRTSSCLVDDDAKGKKRGAYSR